MHSSPADSGPALQNKKRKLLQANVGGASFPDAKLKAVKPPPAEVKRFLFQEDSYLGQYGPFPKNACHPFEPSPPPDLSATDIFLVTASVQGELPGGEVDHQTHRVFVPVCSASKRDILSAAPDDVSDADLDCPKC